MDDFIFAGESTPLLFQRRTIVLIAIGFVVLIGAYVGMSAALGFSTEINAEPFRQWVEDRGWLGPLLFILIMAASVLFAPIPNVPIFIAAGLAWGAVLGTIYSMAGLILGSIAAFSISRKLGRKWLPRLVGSKASKRLDGLADTMGGRVIFWARMLPAVNFDWISFIAGVTSIRFRVFLVSSTLGMLIPTAVWVVAGEGLGEDFRKTVGAALFWLAGIIVSALYFYYRRRRWLARRAAAAREPAV